MKNDKHYQKLRNKFVGKISTEETIFHKEASELRDKLNQISHKDAFSKEQFNEINTLFSTLNEAFQGKFLSYPREVQTKIVDIIATTDYYVINEILNKLKQLQEQE